MDSSTALAIQSWVLYGVAASLVLARVFFRRITLSSFSYLQADDWIMVTVLAPFTVAIVLANKVSDAEAPNEGRIRYAIEQLQLVVTWLVKACLLVLYWRIFPIISSAAKRTSIVVVAGICVISYLAIQISLIVWRLSQPNDSVLSVQNSPNKTTYHAYSATTLSLSALTTLLVLVIPVPFIPTPRRLLLGILILCGIMALSSGVIARVALFTRYSPYYLFWYTSESSLIIIFANLPFLTAPARVRDFSRNISSSAGQRPLSQWPRSRSSGGQVEECQSTKWGSRVGSMRTTVCELPSSKEWSLCDSSQEWMDSQPSERRHSSDRDVEMQGTNTGEQGKTSS